MAPKRQKYLELISEVYYVGANRTSHRVFGRGG